MSNIKIATTEIADAVVHFYNAKRTPIFVGSPGMGKTALVREGGKQLSQIFNTPFDVRELHLASMSEPDVRGYLIPDGNKAVFTQPEFWAAVEKCPHGILFLDEFTQCSHEMQKAVAPLILERRIGEYTLPDGWMVVCAGNRLEDKAGSNSLLSHVMNRLFYVEVDRPDTDEWVAWAVKEQLPHELIVLAKLRPNVVFESDLPDAADQPYCTPRSVEALGRVANVFPGGLSEMVASNMGMALMSASIGQGAAAEVAGLVRTTLRLPSFEDAMADPEGTLVPTDLAEAYAMVMLVAVRAKADQHMEQAGQYLTRFQPNISLTGMVALMRRDRAFMNSKSIYAWVTKNREMVARFQKYITLS